MYARTISMLFYMFFTCVIFNPQVKGVTIYLYVMLPLLDPGFASFALATVRRWALPLTIAVAACLISSPMAAARVVSIAICVGYLMYTYARKIDYLHLWMGINVLFAIVQFITYYADYSLAVQLGPDEVSKMLWGDSATQTNTNFYEILYFARVCGFSREAGFFSSLLAASFVLYLMQREKTSKFMMTLYWIGLFISLSKASAVLGIFAVLYFARRSLRSIHPLVAIGIFTCVMGAMGLYMRAHGFFGVPTFAHRMGGYPFLLDARFSDLIKGVSTQQLLNDYGYLPYVHMNREVYYVNEVTFASIPGLIIDMGLIPALILLGVLGFTASDGFVMLMTLLITATLGPTMVTSFVPLAYLICYWPRFSIWLADARARMPVPQRMRLLGRLKPAPAAPPPWHAFR